MNFVFGSVGRRGEGGGVSPGKEKGGGGTRSVGEFPGRWVGAPKKKRDERPAKPLCLEIREGLSKKEGEKSAQSISASKIKGGGGRGAAEAQKGHGLRKGGEKEEGSLRPRRGGNAASRLLGKKEKKKGEGGGGGGGTSIIDFRRTAPTPELGFFPSEESTRF